jgi:hypothetical protein
MKFLSSTLVVNYDSASQNLQISHPDQRQFSQPLVTIRAETYSAMSLEELAEFLGSRLLLLIPEMREHYKDHIEQLAASKDGNLPKKSLL